DAGDGVKGKFAAGLHSLGVDSCVSENEDASTIGNVIGNMRGVFVAEYGHFGQDDDRISCGARSEVFREQHVEWQTVLLQHLLGGMDCWPRPWPVVGEGIAVAEYCDVGAVLTGTKHGERPEKCQRFA